MAGWRLYYPSFTYIAKEESFLNLAVKLVH